MNGKQIQAIKLYQNNKSANEIYEEIGMPPTTLYNLLHKVGVHIRSRKEAYALWGKKSRIPMEEVAELYQSGKSLSAVAIICGLDRTTVWKRLRKMGVKIRTVHEAVKSIKRLKGENSPYWKGGYINSWGYRVIRYDGKPKLEHQVVWEKEHGPLPKGWIIHHFNGIRSDNRPENLFGMPRKRHSPTLIIEPFRKRILELEQKLEALGKKL